jgi:hypothetical protein
LEASGVNVSFGFSFPEPLFQPIFHLFKPSSFLITFIVHAENIRVAA